jgi:hypothetical protein
MACKEVVSDRDEPFRRTVRTWRVYYSRRFTTEKGSWVAAIPWRGPREHRLASTRSGESNAQDAMISSCASRSSAIPSASLCALCGEHSPPARIGPTAEDAESAEKEQVVCVSNPESAIPNQQFPLCGEHSSRRESVRPRTPTPKAFRPKAKGRRPGAAHPGDADWQCRRRPVRGGRSPYRAGKHNDATFTRVRRRARRPFALERGPLGAETLSDVRR